MSERLRKRAKRTLMALIGIFPLAVQATHMSGGEIYWDCLGGNSYRITMVIYRDCAGINVDPYYDLNITGPCAQPSTFRVYMDSSQELSQLCAEELPNSTCNGGTMPGIQEYVYSAEITLPPCDSWTISYTNIYRNDAIANLVNPGQQRTYIKAEINTAAAICNDSPQFSNLAIPFVCVGYPVTYSFGAYDPEADSLSYELIPAMGQNGTPLAYVPPYSGAMPIPGLVLDPATGEVNFTLSAVGNWVVVVKVYHWVNGQVTGTIMRDMQFVAAPCSNIPPDPTTGLVTDLAGSAVQTGPRAVEVCSSGSLCFSLTISDPNPDNVLTAFSNVALNLPGATFTYTGTNPIVAEVCWTAQEGVSGLFPFIITVNDGACPIPAFQTYIYSVRVLDGLYATLQTTPESCAGMNDGSIAVTVTAGTGPYGYAWSNGADTPIISGAPGTYSVQLTDANGCVSHALEATIPAGPAAPTANAGADLSACMGTTVPLNGTVTGASGGMWSGGNGQFSGSWPQMYYLPGAAEVAQGSVQLVLTTTGNGACPAATDTLVVQLSNAFLNASLTAQPVNCHGGSDGALAFSPASDALSYVWSQPGAANAPTLTGLSAGTWGVTVTDALGCDSAFTATITEPAPLALTTTANAVTCAGGSNGGAQVSVSGGTAPYTATWANGATGTTIANLSAGAIDVTVTDAQNCVATATVTVNEPAPITLIAQVPDTVCINAPVQLTASAQGGHGGFLYDWGGLGFNDAITVVFTADQTVEVTVTDMAGCPGPVLQMPVHVINIANADIVTYGDTTICPGGTATVGVNIDGVAAPYTLSWQPFAWQGPGPHTFPASNSTPVHVTVTDACGSTALRTIIVAVDVLPDPATLPRVDAVGCSPLAVQFPSLQLPFGATHLWTTSNGLSSSANAPILTFPAGTHTVALTVTTAIGCTVSSDDQGAITVHPSPTAEFTASPWSTDMDAPSITFSSFSTGGTDHSWDFGDGAFATGTQPTHVYTAPGIYTVELLVEDANGCTATVAHPVEIKIVHDIQIPTAFTPDPNGGNGGAWTPGALDNDIFFPFARFVDEFRMRIYNRWGELVFESTDIAIGWDGWYRGQLSPQDVYVVQTWFKFIDGQQVQRLTDLTLLR